MWQDGLAGVQSVAGRLGICRNVVRQQSAAANLLSSFVDAGDVRAVQAVLILAVEVAALAVVTCESKDGARRDLAPARRDLAAAAIESRYAPRPTNRAVFAIASKSPRNRSK